jgi:succinate dehydrogenase / fumarate reductase cytochrome b subunit
MAVSQDSKIKRAAHWADVRGRGLGMWAYALNRVTGIGLVLYLYIHLVVLSMLMGARQPGTPSSRWCEAPCS